MRYILAYLLCLIVIGCQEGVSPETKEALKAAYSQKGNIVIIDIDRKSDEYIGYGLKFRGNAISMVDKIKKFKPAVIFFNNRFFAEEKGAKEFSEKLNKNFPVITAFVLNSDNKELNFTEEVKIRFGSIIPGVRKLPDGSSHVFTGITFPNVEIVRRSKALCSHLLIPNNRGEIEFVNPHNQYRDYLFENCSLTVANAFLAPYNLNIKYESSLGSSDRFRLYALFNNRKEVLKDIGVRGPLGSYQLPIEFEIFRKISAKDFLESTTIQIDPGFIFIINTADTSFKTATGHNMPGVDILASEVYTLLDSIWDP